MIYGLLPDVLLNRRGVCLSRVFLVKQTHYSESLFRIQNKKKNVTKLVFLTEKMARLCKLSGTSLQKIL